MEMIRALQVTPTMTTDYHSQYWAHALTLKSAADSVQNLSRSIANARVDLNPHQVDAALFAFRSPLAKGVGQSIRFPLSQEPLREPRSSIHQLACLR